MKTRNIIIIGQGISGSLLAWRFIQLGYSVIVFDKHIKGSASYAAAGLINPLTGPRLFQQADFYHYLKHALHTYREIEHMFDATYFKPLPQLRYLSEARYQKAFEKRKSDPTYAHLWAHPVDPEIDNPTAPHTWLSDTWKLDIRAFLQAMRTYIKDHAQLVERYFHAEKITSKGRRLLYKAYTADAIIFCEGAMGAQNPWFKELPFELSKGHVIRLSSSRPLSYLINWGRWLSPSESGSSQYILGTDYAHHDLSPQVDEAKVSALVSEMKQWCFMPDLNIIEKTCAVRPTTRDRRVIMQSHSTLSGVHFFNGLGSKGCLLAPYYAQQLVHKIHSGYLNESH